MHHVKVDVYGSCGPLRCNKNEDCYQMMNQTYKFYLSLENSVCKENNFDQKSFLELTRMNNLKEKSRNLLNDSQNCCLKDYVTEKFFNILNYDVIPVVLNGADMEAIAPPHSYINVQVSRYIIGPKGFWKKF